MKLTDYVVEFLADHRVSHVFGLTGGAVVHLFDSADRGGRVRPVFHHHEQAAAFAAQAYARIVGNVGACFVTTGPGVTNALTGLAAAWLDSVPCIYISGQTRLAHTALGRSVRQIGTQHIEVLPIVSSMTKYAALVDDARQIRFHLEKAFSLATSGRQGPVWLDLPLDLQWADIEPAQLIGYTPDTSAAENVSAQVASVLRLLSESKRPLLLAGYGVPLSGAQVSFKTLVDRHQIPFVTTWGAVDILPSSHPLNLGRPGLAGNRAANLAVQNCDLLLAVGSHLPIPVTGTMFESFAREAKVVVVDIDPEELRDRQVRIDVAIEADARSFIEAVLGGLPADARPGSSGWHASTQLYREKYLAGPPPSTDAISPYDFVRTLSELSDDDDIVVVDGGGTNVYVSFQTFTIKGSQRMILSTGLCAMGSGLPESIGACYAAGRRRTLCLCGDGSLQLNIQELQTIVDHRLPIKIFVTENAGYLSIRGTQKEFLQGNYAGSEASGGMNLPDYTKVAAAYGVAVFSVHRPTDLSTTISEALSAPGPVVCVVHTSPTQEIIPRQGFDRQANGTFAPRPLEDMAPFLDREEFARAMLIEPWGAPSRSHG